MKIEMRFPTKPPEFVDGVERMQIRHGNNLYTLVQCEGSWLYLTIDQPLDRTLIIHPNSSRGVTIGGLKR